MRRGADDTRTLDDAPPLVKPRLWTWLSRRDRNDTRALNRPLACGGYPDPPMEPDIFAPAAAAATTTELPWKND